MPITRNSNPLSPARPSRVSVLAPACLALCLLTFAVVGQADGQGADARQNLGRVVPDDLALPQLPEVEPAPSDLEFEQSRQLFLDGEVQEAQEQWLAIVARDGDDVSQAHYALGTLYEFGARGVEEQPQLAAQLYGLACRADFVDACTNLGVMYSVGRGVDKDETAAARLWEVAANAGHCLASFNLGLSYYGGKGVELDRELAIARILDAADCKVPEAQYAACQFYNLGIGVEVNQGVALSYCQSAARGGIDNATSLAGQLMLQGVEPVDPANLQRAISPIDEEPDRDGDGATQQGDQAGQGEETLTGDTSEQLDDAAGELDGSAPTADQENTADQETAGQETAGQETAGLETAGTGIEVPQSPDTDTTQVGAAGQLTAQVTAKAASVFALAGQAGSQESSAVAVPAFPSINTTANNTAARIEYFIQGEEILRSQLPVRSKARPMGMPGNQPLIALWLGSGADLAQAERMWGQIEDKLSEVLDGPVPVFQPVLIPRELVADGETISVHRIYLGPIPDPETGWQICNVLRLDDPGLFCKPWDVSQM